MSFGCPELIRVRTIRGVRGASDPRNDGANPRSNTYPKSRHRTTSEPELPRNHHEPFVITATRAAAVRGPKRQQKTRTVIQVRASARVSCTRGRGHVVLGLRNGGGAVMFACHRDTVALHVLGAQDSHRAPLSALVRPLLFHLADVRRCVSYSSPTGLSTVLMTLFVADVIRRDLAEPVGAGRRTTRAAHIQSVR